MTNSATHTKAALYLRLSRDDDLTGDSSSIMTQRQILQKYAKENNFFVVDEYVDAADIIGLKQKPDKRASL